MKYTATFITKHKKLIIIMFLAVTAVCVVLSGIVRVNYNLSDYLPEEAESTIALNLMEKEFDSAAPNAQMMFSDVSITEALRYKEEIAEIDGVREVMWLDDIIDIKAPLEMADQKTVETYYKDQAALFSVTIDEENETEVVNTLRSRFDGKALFTGDAIQNVMTRESGNIGGIMGMVLVIIVIILILTTSSWLEPLLFFATIGVAIMINMGLNAFTGGIVYVTQTVSPILQLAVSLDYAIFLLHSFEKQRQDYQDPNIAMRKAIEGSFTSIIASASTTLFGFLALVVMDFKIGPDLGSNLAKGVILSFLSVMVFLPALTLSCLKLLDKTRHKPILGNLEGAGKILGKVRMPALILVMMIAVPCFLAQNHSAFTYGNSEATAETKYGEETKMIQDKFGDSISMVVLVPKGDIAREKELCTALDNISEVTSVMSFAKSVDTTIPIGYLEDGIVANFYSENYARIVLGIDTSDEGDKALSVVKEIRSTVKKFYAESYTCGQSANLYDMKITVTKDNLRTNTLALIAIFIVLLITFKSISLPFILLFVILSAIWINLSVPYFAGDSILYIGYLVINTVQLGATIDYAILITESYMEHRTGKDKRGAVKATISTNFISVLTSASILAAAGFGLYILSADSIVSELGLLLGRGTVLSFLSVTCVLPALLLIFDAVVQKTTLKATKKVKIFIKEEVKV